MKPDARITTIAQELGIDDAEIERRKSFLEFTDADVENTQLPGLPVREHVQQKLLLQQCQVTLSVLTAYQMAWLDVSCLYPVEYDSERAQQDFVRPLPPLPAVSFSDGALFAAPNQTIYNSNR